MTRPLTPADCDLRDFPRMMIDISRLRQSEFDATPDDGAWRAGLNLWFSAWHSVPAGSLAADDASLAKAAGLGRDLRTWKKVKSAALKGFVACDDGRLYHATVSEFALEAWIEKLVQRLSSGAGNAKRWGGTFDPTATEAAIDDAAGLLTALAPASKSIAKARRRHSRPDDDGNPTGKKKTSHRDAETIQVGSQEKGEGTGNIGSVPDGTGAGAPLSAMPQFEGKDPKAKAWAVAKHLLAERGGLTAARAGDVVGKLMRDHGLDADDLIAIADACWATRSESPVPYITKAAQEVIARRRSPGGQIDAPSERQQVSWMEDLRESEFSWRPERGPRPGQAGCRVSAEIQRRYGFDPAPQLAGEAA